MMHGHIARRWTASLFLGCAGAISAASLAAQTIPICKAISDDKARLACFDAIPVSETKPPVATNVSRAQAAVRSELKDPRSAMFTETKERAASDGTKAVCGFVNSKNAMGGYGGKILFVYIVSSSKAYVLDPNADRGPVYSEPAIAAYKKYCS